MYELFHGAVLICGEVPAFWNRKRHWGNGGRGQVSVCDCKETLYRKMVLADAMGEYDLPSLIQVKLLHFMFFRREAAMRMVPEFHTAR